MFSWIPLQPSNSGGRTQLLARKPAAPGVRSSQMNLVRVGLVGLFCALVGTGVAAAANGSGADSAPTSTVAPVAQSGNTGNVHVASQATNSGNTGASNSSAIANPVSQAG